MKAIKLINISQLKTERKPKLLEQIRTELRINHYSKKTEEAYVSWIKRFIYFHNKRHPKEMDAEEIKQFISHIATNQQVSSSTQNQALNAILYLYKNVIKKEIKFVEGFGYVKRIRHLPVVFSREESTKVLNQLDGTIQLVVKLLYGTGMRLSEGLRLRVKDIDFDEKQITVRDGKGEKDRITLLPEKLFEPLKKPYKKSKELTHKRLEGRFGRHHIALRFGTKISECR